jgi:plastocyanin
MNTKIIVAIVAILAIGGLVAWMNQSRQATVEEEEGSLPIVIEDETTAASPSAAQESTTITYKDGAFSPSEVEIAAGTAVTFKNESSKEEVWPASNPHPIHTGLSGFDANKGLKLGETYTFTFNKAGSFGFHDHLHPKATGKVTVK